MYHSNQHFMWCITQIKNTQEETGLCVCLLLHPLPLVPKVKLKDSLMSSVIFSQAKDAELAWVDGQIHFSSATSKGVVGIGGNENNTDHKTDLVPVLDGLPQNQVGDDFTLVGKSRGFFCDISGHSWGVGMCQLVWVLCQLFLSNDKSYAISLNAVLNTITIICTYVEPHVYSSCTENLRQSYRYVNHSLH